MVVRAREAWRPLHCSAPGLVRRLFDLQVGSVWRDVAAAVASARGRVLDVGCGAQPYRRLFPAGVDYRAIDSEDVRDHFGYSAPDTVYYSGPRWPVEDCSVETILCTETLEHAPDPKGFLGEAQRCLTHGGRLILTVPFAARWHYIPHDYWRYTPSGLDLLLRSAGLEEIEVYARGNSLTVACYKNMAVVIQLLMPQAGPGWRRLAGRVLGVFLSPLFLACALVGNLSLYSEGGEDCLGYTALARKPLATPKDST